MRAFEYRGGALRRVKRRLLAAAFCAGMLFVSGPAEALTSEEVAKVADLIAALQPTLGEFAYDEEIARDWFQMDAEDDRVIQEAGFTAESWEVAVGDTFRGLIALLPQSEIDALRAKLDGGLEGLPQLSEEQKAEAMQELEDQFARMLAMRAEGAAFVDAVRPVEQRLNTILQSASE